MFIGEYQHTIDEKGRLFIPSKFREGLGTSFFITKGFETCLFAYPAAEWASLEEKLRSLPFTQKSARAFVRLFFSGAAECSFDKQGRILIPNTLREYARLTRDAVIIGVASRVEIWAKEEWEKFSAEAEPAYEQFAEEIGGFSL